MSVREAILIHDQLRMTYTPLCFHKQKYPFKNPKFEDYMRQCQGWVEDEEGKYTVNYIILVLLAEIKNRHHLVLDKYDRYIILCDQRLTDILSTGYPYLEIRLLRAKILDHMDHNEQDVSYYREYDCPLWCLKNMERVLHRIFDDFEEIPTTVAQNFCSNE